MEILDYNQSDKLTIEQLISDNSMARMDIIRSLDENPEFGKLVIDNGEIIAVGAFTGFSKKSKLNLYVSADRRNEGIGTKLLSSIEDVMRNGGVEEIVCSYVDNEIERKFIYKNGFTNWFFSNHMVYEKDKFIMPLETGEIRNYSDDDYSVCQKVYSEAFYRMGQMVGFETTLSKPSEKERESFKNNADNMFVLVENNSIVASATIDENELDLVAVAVDEQRKGYGEKITRFCVNELMNRGNNQVVLWCVEGNPAKHLYDKMGFKVVDLHEFVKKKI